jgi:hypothetical protein
MEAHNSKLCQLASAVYTHVCLTLQDVELRMLPTFSVPLSEKPLAVNSALASAVYACFSLQDVELRMLPTFSAPGGGLLSSIPGNNFALYQGTSMVSAACCCCMWILEYISM